MTRSAVARLSAQPAARAAQYLPYMARLLRLAASSALVLLALICLTSSVTAQCGLGDVDLSSIAGKDWTGSDDGAVYSYAAHVCGPVVNAGACIQNGVPGAACQIQNNGPTYLTGFWQNPQWMAIDGGVQYYLQGTNACKPHNFAQKYTATFVFKCAENQDDHFTVVPGVCDQTWTMKTPAACSSGAASSTGSTGGATGRGLTRSATIGIVVGSVVSGLLLLAAAGIP